MQGVSHAGSAEAAIIPMGNGVPWQMQQEFSEEEAALMRIPSQFSSTLREVRTVRLALEALTGMQPAIPALHAAQQGAVVHRFTGRCSSSESHEGQPAHSP